VRGVVVLGGGGAKALAHPGVWQALGEAGIEPVHVVGTSMGAVMGAALAQGTAPEAVLRTAQALGPKDVATLRVTSLLKGIFAASILKEAALRRTIARLAPATTFAALRLPLTVTATDLDSGELALFGAVPSDRRSAETSPPGPRSTRETSPPGPLSTTWRGGTRGPADVPLHDALYASCALPLYFPPAVIAGRRLADGGLRAVLPLAVAARIPADVVIAVHVGSGFDEPPRPDARGRHAPALIRAHDEALRIMMAAETERAVESWPAGAPRLVVVRPVAEREATFALGQSERYFAAGYEAAREALRHVAV
jgi:NTE family protein